MASQLYNNVSDALLNSIDNSQTSFDLVSGNIPAVDPGDYIPIYVTRASDGAFEIMHVTGVSGSTITVDRAAESTSPLTFPSGDSVQIRPTRQSLLEMGVDVSDNEVSTSTGDQSLSDALDQRGPVFVTVSAMDASTGLSVGVTCKTLGYSFIGDGGGNEYEIVAAATGTDDGGSFIDLSGSGHQAKGLFPKGVVTPEMFGATVDGSTDNSAEINASAAYVRSSGGTLAFGTKTYVGESLNIDDIDIECKGRDRTKLLHKAASTANLIDVTTSLTLRDLTIDGNRANRTDRDAGSIQVASGKVFVSDIDFKSSIRAGINGNNTLDELVVRDCRFFDMAEHSGTFGDSTGGIRFNGPISDGKIDVKGCAFTHDTVVNADRVPGGVFVSCTSGFASVYVSGCEFTNIGQRTDDGGNANFLGCIDLYNNVGTAKLIGNTFNNYYYTPIKMQNCSNVTATGNAIKENADASSSSAIIFQNARDYQGNMIYCNISDNLVDLSGEAVDGISVAGDPDDAFVTSRIVISGNVVNDANRGINVSRAGEASVTGNVVSRCDVSFRLSEEPTSITNSTYTYTGNHSINPTSNHMLMDMGVDGDGYIAISGNVLLGGTTGDYAIDLRYFQFAAINGNVLTSGATNFARIRDGVNATIVGNASQTSANGVASSGLTKLVDANNTWN